METYELLYQRETASLTWFPKEAYSSQGEKVEGREK